MENRAILLLFIDDICDLTSLTSILRDFTSLTKYQHYSMRFYFTHKILTLWRNKIQVGAVHKGRPQSEGGVCPVRTRGEGGLQIWTSELCVKKH